MVQWFNLADQPVHRVQRSRRARRATSTYSVSSEREMTNYRILNLSESVRIPVRPILKFLAVSSNL